MKRVAISVVRPFHATLMANALAPNAAVAIYTSAPRRFFPGLASAVQTHLIPSPIHLFSRVIPLRPATLRQALPLWDRMVATTLPTADLTIGFATQALAVARKTHRRGLPFWLDRACPHVDAQQQIIREESEATGATYTPEPPSFRDRQLEEYALANRILVPSRYTAQSFPPELQPKLLLAPLLGRTQTQHPPRPRNPIFTVGVLGGNPLRKGLLYLLEAWHRLALPNARLLLRTADLTPYPRLAKLAKHPTIELLPYLPDVSAFYARCDVFALPSVDDGFGMALFEAIAAGIPTITTTQTGAAELLTHAHDALIVPPRDPEALAQALKTLHTDEPQRERLALNAQQTLTRITHSELYARALHNQSNSNPVTPSTSLRTRTTIA